jgi:flavin reductase (DIM6/NTAB) family NADH-FMN oxidoreductase RutF
MVLVCVDRRSEAHTGFQASGIFGVSVLAEHQEELSRRFAGGVDDKFAGIELVSGRSGAALIPGALAHLECRLVFAHPGGDHTIYVGEVESLSVFPGRPLLYHGSGYRRLDTGNGTGAC